MTDNNKHQTIANNRFSFETFVCLFTVAVVLFEYLYVHHFATISVKGSRMITLVIITFIITLGMLILSWKLERNWMSIICSSLLPILIFDNLSIWKYFTGIRITVLLGNTVSIIVGVVIVARKTKHIKNIRIRRTLLTIKATHKICAFCCFFLLAGCLLGKGLIAVHYQVSYTDISYQQSDSYNDIPDYENSLDANIEQVQQLDAEGGWNSLTFEEKKQLFETIIRIEGRYLGMHTVPSLEIAYLEEGLLGQYDHERDTITLSYSFIVDSKADGYFVCQTLCHEMRHRFQWEVVRLLEEVRKGENTKEFSDLLLFDSVVIYETELNNYITADGDSDLSYYLYKSQQVEVDADKYGTESMIEYYNRIQDYLDAQKDIDNHNRQ